MKKIPVKRAKEFAGQNNLDQVIIFGFNKKSGATHCLTYGKTVEDCAQAAQGGNTLKKSLGWPDKYVAEPPRVKKLLSKIKKLEDSLKFYAGSKEDDDSWANKVTLDGGKTAIEGLK